MSNHYTPKQIDIMLNLYFRNHMRETPWPTIAKTMGVVLTATAFNRLLWGVITGYSNDETGPRLVYTPTDGRVGRVGWEWFVREDRALRAALAGAGRMRTPPCDISYIAAVLARNEKEVEAHWKELNADELGRGGFAEAGWK